MLALIIIVSILGFLFIVSNLVWFFFYKKKVERIEIYRETISNLPNDSKDKENIRGLKNEKLELGKEISCLREENIKLRDSNNQLLEENYHLKDKNKILDAKNLQIEQDFAKVIPINRELFTENENLRIQLNSKEEMINHLKSTSYLRAVVDGTQKQPEEEFNKIHPPSF